LIIELKTQISTTQERLITIEITSFIYKEYLFLDRGSYQSMPIGTEQMCLAISLSTNGIYKGSLDSWERERSSSTTFLNRTLDLTQALACSGCFAV